MRIVLAALVLIGLGTDVRAAPTVHVTLPAIRIDHAERTTLVEATRRAMQDIDAKSIDVTISKLDAAIDGDRVVLSAEVKVMVVKRGDRIHSIASTKASLAVARRSFDAKRAGALRRQVLGAALASLQRRLRPVVASA